MNYKRVLLKGGPAAWTLLGFKRGLDSYDYKYNKQCNKNNPYLYSTKISYGLFGSFIYINPIALIITLSKEIYRFEVWARNLDEEKTTDYYNDLL